MITRVVEAFEEDYELQIWLMTAPESEVRTVTDGYQQLVEALNHDSTAAARDARRALEMPLPQACAMFVRRWYQAVFEREQGEGKQDIPHRE
jgi:hypothetical protein